MTNSNEFDFTMEFMEHRKYIQRMDHSRLMRCMSDITRENKGASESERRMNQKEILRLLDSLSDTAKEQILTDGEFKTLEAQINLLFKNNDEWHELYRHYQIAVKFYSRQKKLDSFTLYLSLLVGAGIILSPLIASTLFGVATLNLPTMAFAILAGAFTTFSALPLSIILALVVGITMVISINTLLVAGTHVSEKIHPTPKVKTDLSILSFFVNKNATHTATSDNKESNSREMESCEAEALALA